MMPLMRTTINLDDDLLDKARESARRMRKPFRAVVNEALRVGLEHADRGQARTPTGRFPTTWGFAGA